MIQTEDTVLIGYGRQDSHDTLRLQSSSQQTDYLLLLIGNSGRINVNGRSISAESNSFLLLPFSAGMIVLSTHQELCYVWYHVRLSDAMRSRIDEKLCSGQSMLTSVRPLAAAEIQEILSMYAGRPDADAICSHALSLLICLLVHTSSEQQSKAASIPHFDKLTALRKDIYQFPAENWYIQDICDRLCISRPYFHRIYQAAFGVSCTQDVIASRIARSKKLLETTEDAISDISQQCGFETDAYFMRQFKRHVGMTPTVYRRICRQKHAT